MYQLEFLLLRLPWQRLLATLEAEFLQDRQGGPSKMSRDIFSMLMFLLQKAKCTAQSDGENLVPMTEMFQRLTRRFVVRSRACKGAAVSLMQRLRRLFCVRMRAWA